MDIGIRVNEVARLFRHLSHNGLMKRYLTENIEKDLPHKIVLLSGPRQSGKTTLAKQFRNNYDYFNYDLAEDRHALQKKRWNRAKPLIIFDELHKMRFWKRWLKGIYDTEGIPPEILVTGSAKMNVYRRVGDSLAGRYFSYTLHPLDLKEAKRYDHLDEQEIFERLWRCSGFPEPFLSGSETFYKRWRQSHLDIILRQDLIDLHAVRDIKAIETLVLLLKEHIGKTVSYANLARDLDRDANTIKRWLQLLEELYIIYRVTPYYNLARSIRKEPKYFFYDHVYAENDHGAKLENLVANALFKELHYLRDTRGIKTSLHFLRTKDGKEVDFLTCLDDKPSHLIEVKSADETPAHRLKYFSKWFPTAKKIQLVKTLRRESTSLDGIEIRKLIPWLANLDLSRK